ncbi:MAG: hypothetical protein M1268_03490 [Patescibacteria group bacterium]|nr:hypothetical protein [Patescibacteria group bacterium]
MRKVIYLSAFFFAALFFISFNFIKSAYAGTISNTSDTITTSRPSASTPISADQAAAATSVTIWDNKSIFLASDSAVLWPDTGETLNTVTVASMSASGVGGAGKRTVYFTGTAANTHHSGDVITSAITAMHKVQFTLTTPIPASGKIILTFPGTAVTTASPSATTFSFNGLTTANAATNISYQLVAGGARTCTFAVATVGSSPTITCTVDAGAGLAAGQVVTFLIGCADASANVTTCTTQSPRLINPTKTAAGGEGVATTTADIWKINIETQDASSGTLDTGSAKIATIESVQVQALVDPSLTFSIAGIANNTAINNGNTGCANAEVTNAGIGSTATSVNLGILSSTINISAQLLTITTNAPNGYSLTATSSGHLINPATGFWIADSTTPTAMTAGTPWFGLHPCGTDVTAGTWGTGATGGGINAKYGWPTQASSVTLASKATGPVGLAGTTNGLTSVEYAATVDVSVPAGKYTSVVTYVATPTF